MYKISKQFSFSAAHALTHLPENHKCARLHGHNYVVTVCLKNNELNTDGFVRDYGELSVVADFIKNELDHRFLNDILPFYSTAENIAKFIFDKFKPLLPELYAVEVSESPKTNAMYEPDSQ